MAAVCGFEAFINGKHIVGEVKEKETAHKEYKKAISEGHGAYLMDQDEETPVCIIYEKGEVGINIGKNVKMEIGYNKNINKICYNFSFKNIEILLLIIFIQNLYILT